MSALQSIRVPMDVPKGASETYLSNLSRITHDTGRLMLFAGDQKIEHLNDDFFGDGIHKDDNDPMHLFSIASGARIGCFATQLGLIAAYGADFPEIAYLVKLNSKTHLVKTKQKDPLSCRITTVDQVVRFKEQSGLCIAGIGYTIYLGSEYEHLMIREAAESIGEAHQHGLITVLWIYPRGAAVTDEKDPHLIAGAAGVAATLGSDFVKVNPPKKEGFSSSELLKEATQAAGRTRVVCAGGSSVDVSTFLSQLYDQIHIGGCFGNATGRNIHQKPLDEAIRMCNAIYAITVENADVATAMTHYQKT
ncbi:MAG: aldolase [Methanospirillaceae archaeon]|nr:aldolase [Methanospirillaceae archaeon]